MRSLVVAGLLLTVFAFAGCKGDPSKPEYWDSATSPPKRIEPSSPISKLGPGVMNPRGRSALPTSATAGLPASAKAASAARPVLMAPPKDLFISSQWTLQAGFSQRVLPEIGAEARLLAFGPGLTELSGWFRRAAGQ